MSEISKIEISAKIRAKEEYSFKIYNSEALLPKSLKDCVEEIEEIDDDCTIQIGSVDTYLGECELVLADYSRDLINEELVLFVDSEGGIQSTRYRVLDESGESVIFDWQDRSTFEGIEPNFYTLEIEDYFGCFVQESISVFPYIHEPYSLTADPEGFGATLTWEYDDETAIDGYNVYYKFEGDEEFIKANSVLLTDKEYLLQVEDEGIVEVYIVAEATSFMGSAESLPSNIISSEAGFIVYTTFTDTSNSENVQEGIIENSTFSEENTQSNEGEGIESSTTFNDTNTENIQ